MSGKLDFFTDAANEAAATLRVSLERARAHRSTADYDLSEKYTNNAANWASIYTACKLIIAEETEAEELRKMEERASER